MQKHLSKNRHRNKSTKTELLEGDCVYARIAELEQHMSQQESTIAEQEELIERLRSRLREEWRNPNEPDGKPELVTKKNIGSYTRKYGDSEIIFEEGSNGKDMYFIVHGEVEVSHHVGTKKMIIATLDSGDFFGEMAPLTGYNRTMTIAARGNVYLWKMSADEMLKYMALSPRFAMYICVKMSTRLGYTNLILKHLVPHDVDSSFYSEAETIAHLYAKLSEKSMQMKDIEAELRKKDNDIRDLQRQLRIQNPSLFLRGLERSRESRNHRQFSQKISKSKV